MPNVDAHANANGVSGHHAARQRNGGEAPKGSLPRSVSFNNDHIDEWVSAPGLIRRASTNSSMFIRTTAGDECRPWLIVGVIWFKERLEPNTVWMLLQQRLVSFERFRSRAIFERNYVFFEEIPLEELDRSYHMRVVDATGWEHKDLNQMMTDIYMEDKDKDKPLWGVIILQNIQPGKSALIINVDHALGDGVCMVEALLSTFDGYVLCPNSKTTSPATKEQVQRRKAQALKIPLLTQLSSLCFGFIQPVSEAVRRRDPPNALMPKARGIGKRIVSAELLSLEMVKEVKEKFRGSTVNDVLSALLALALRRYYTELSDPVLGNWRGIRACFSVSLRRPNQKIRETFGNRVCNDFLRICFTSMGSRSQVVWAMKRQIDSVKCSPAALCADFLLGIAGKVLSSSLLAALFKFAISKYTIILSNVPGPQNTCFFGGVEVEDIQFYTFLPTGGIYVGIASYNGKVSCNLAVDSSLPNPAALARCWKIEFDELYSETMAHDGPIPEPLEEFNWGFAVSVCAGALLVAFVVARRR